MFVAQPGCFLARMGRRSGTVFHAENKLPEENLGSARYTMAERLYCDEESGRPIF